MAALSGNTDGTSSGTAASGHILGKASAVAPASPALQERTLQRHPRPLGGDPVRRLEAPLLSLDVLNNEGGAVQAMAQKRKPKWLRAKIAGGPGYQKLRNLLGEKKLHTVCEEACCPNMGECWARGIATIMILGDTCTRSCGFCNIKTGRPNPMDPGEPARVAESVRAMQEGAGLRHLVITSVDRDDQPDGGAAAWAETIRRVRDACPGLSIEVLIPDFKGDLESLQLVIDAAPEILNHNMESVHRTHPAVRPQAKYERSMEVLRVSKERGMVTKTGIMLGIGERDHEVLELMDDLQDPTKGGGVDILTVGQYLQPTPNHLPIDRFVAPDVFDRFREQGLARGFKVVESGPMVRSSYHADAQVAELYGEKRRSYETLQELIKKDD